MKGSRTKDQDKAKVIEAKVNNPDMTLKEIEEQTGVKSKTAHDILKKDLPEVRKSSENIAKVIDTNNSIISVAKGLINTYLPTLEIKSHQDLKSIDSIAESAIKQNQLFNNKPTEKVEMDINIENASMQQMIDYLKDTTN